MKSLFRLLIGFSPKKSGVFSAGNGPAMRASIIGILYGTDHKKLKDFIQASSEITHSDPKAFFASTAVALAAYLSASD